MNYRQFFTQAAIKAVEFSQYIAQRRGKGYIGTGQLLLGILHMRDTIAAEALDKFGVDYDSAEQVIRSSDGFQDVLRPDETPYYTRRAQRVMQGAIDAAREERSFVTTEHILLSLLTEAEGTAVRTIEELDVDVEEVQSEVLERMSEAEEEPKEKTARKKKGKGERSGLPASIKKFGRDLIEAARTGGLDPVIDRDAEIDRVIQILGACRRHEISR